MLLQTPTDSRPSMRVDLHVHSKYSTRPSQWVLQKLNCPESFTDPKTIYARAKAKGMDLVTVSDHNSIDGALEIAHLQNVFISEEITTYFPADRCKLHVLALNINEAQHRDIQHLRENVFDLVDYLSENGILHVLAHPLYDMNHLLSWDHIEQLLLLFSHIELNGAREQAQNECLQRIVADLDAARMWDMAERQGVRPRSAKPWLKHLVGGSDDHSSLNIARMHTQVFGAADWSSFFTGLTDGHCCPVGTPASPRTMAHNLYGIAYQFYRSKFQVGELVSRETLMQFSDSILTGHPPREEGFRDRIPSLLSLRKLLHRFSGKHDTSVLDMVLDEAKQVMESRPDLLRRVWEQPGARELENDWFEVVNRMAGRMSAHFSDTVLESVAGAKLFNIFQTLGSAGTIYSLLAPYFLAYTFFSRDRQFSEECLRRFSGRQSQDRSEDQCRLAVFTDTFTEMNGVALTLQQQLSVARAKLIPFHILTCGQSNPPQGVTDFASQGSFSLPEYPEQELHYPPFLEMLDHCYQQRFSHILASTPGPLGLAALGIARILKLPVYATYHTAVPQYVLERTGDRDMEELIWKGMIWYYNQMNTVFVPSRTIANELIDRGLAPDKVEISPCGIDTATFCPQKRNGFWKDYFADTEETVKLLYVGRISREKNLDILVQAYTHSLCNLSHVQLIIVGDGPSLPWLKQQLAGHRAIFTGPLEGEALAQAYASSDLFIFPSTTDTFGNVVLEAQASGLPVIVTDRGGPQENMLHGETGYVVPANDPQALAETVRELVDDREKLERMKRQARSYCRHRTFESAFLDHWEMYKACRSSAETVF